MPLTAEQQRELAAFPQACLDLIHAELAAGNTIVEVSHSFPAPPSGAYVQFANVISTRARASGFGLTYRARYSAISSGEFTDADRRYFVVEPPLSEEEVKRLRPNMDVIRREIEMRSHPSPQIARVRRVVAQTGEPELVLSDNAHVATDLPSGDIQLLHFRDTRPFHEVQFAFEHRLVALFVRELVNNKLSARAEANVNGARYVYTLYFDAALPSTNCFSFRAEGSWTRHTANHDDYFRRVSGSWFAYWTSDVTPANPPGDAEGSADRYAAVSEAAMRAEDDLDSVHAIQQAIVTDVKAGGAYRTSDKEGSTEIAWRHGAFIRESQGDDTSVETFGSEDTFLTMLWHFCQADITRHAVAGVVSDVDMWRLISRQLLTR